MRRLPLLLGLSLLAATMVNTSFAATDVKSQLSAIERETAVIRGLKAGHGIQTQLLADRAFVSAYSATLHRDLSDSELTLQTRELRVLGLISKKDNLRKTLFQSGIDSVLAFYDPHQKILFLRNVPNIASGPERHTIAREYTLALQDQHFDLTALLPDQFPLAYRNSDMVTAHRALSEGDATNTDELFIHQTYTRRDLKGLVEDESKQPVAAMPKSIKREVYFPYLSGFDFVHALYIRKGLSGVNAAFARPPGSTYEILHPGAYLKGWSPAQVSLHAIQGFSPWLQVDDDVLGALGYQVALWKYLGGRSANQVVNGYSGDRYIFLEHGTQNAMLMRSEWKNPAAARLAESEWLRALGKRYPHHRTTRAAGSLFVSGNHAFYLSTAADSMTLAIAPTAAIATQLGTATTT